MALLVYMNLPLVILTLLGACAFFSYRIDKTRRERAFKTGRCQKPDPTTPDHICGMPIVAHMDVYGAYGFKFFQWLCDEHARDGERRLRGGMYRIEWLRAPEPPPSTGRSRRCLTGEGAPSTQ